VRTFEFRAISPLFDGSPFTVCAAPQADPKAIRLWAKNSEGRLAMEAAATVD